MINTSSYVVFDGGATIRSSVVDTGSGCPGRAKYVTYYSRTGVPLATIPNDFMFPRILGQIDPAGGKPQVKSYRRVYWPGIGYKGCPGYAVYYHDIHNHRLGWERMEKSTDPIPTNKFDISQAYEEESDFSRAPAQKM